jgi:diaminopimelate epimerase
MRFSFAKMHGLGNDFIVFDGEQALPEAATLRRLADRHTGIGFDQALALYPPRRPGTDLYYRIFNSDGSEVEQCGNGARCIAAHAAARLGRRHATLAMDSPGGIVSARVLNDGIVAVGMGVPDFAPAALPFLAAERADVYDLTGVGDGHANVRLSAVSIGNPHAVLLVDDLERAPVASLGPALEYDHRFPKRTNVGFLRIVSASRVRLRVHERGAGETRACGTGACAAVAVGRQLGLLGPRVDVELPGGQVTVEWPGTDETIWLTGPTATAFEGHTEL